MSRERAYFVILDADDGASFEDRMWAGWPPIPYAVRWVFCNVLTWRHRGYWKFASCDGSGKKQKLYAVGPEEEK